MNRKLRKLLALAMACVMMFCTAGAFDSEDVESAENRTDTAAANDFETDEFAGFENRGQPDDMAKKTDEELLAEILADPSCSEESKEQLLLKERLLQEALERQQNDGPTARETSYFVDVVPIMQEYGTKCAPATIQMVLNHFGYEYESQTKIQKSINRESGTDLSLVMEYLNEAQSENKYARRIYKNEKELLLFLDVAAQLDLPVIHTAKVSREDCTEGVWPYKTNGHFFILCGRSRTGQYVASDPYYYPKYVSDVTANGRHETTYDNIAKVSQNYGNTDKNGNPVGYIGY